MKLYRCRPATLWRWLRRRITGDGRMRRAALWLRARPLMPFQRRLGGRRMDHHEIGAMGEIIAARWLATKGRKVLYRNFHGLNGGEVDIVARHREILTFVEVKCRTSTAFGRPADAVNAGKQRLIQRAAKDWLYQLGRPRIPFRFDIVEVVLTEGHPPYVNIIENAFQMPDNSMVGR
jgi:putative endonuclease